MVEERPGRRRWTLSLRALLGAVALIAVCVGWVVRRATVQRDAVAAVVGGGGQVRYDWDTLIPRDRTAPMTKGVGHPAAPKWLVDALGVDYFGTVRAVYLGSKDPDGVMAAVGNLDGLRQLDTIDQAQLSTTGLVQVARLRQLWRLNLPTTPLTGEGFRILCRAPAVETLNVSHRSDIGDDDLAHVVAWKGLRSLALACPRVTDVGVGHLRALSRLVVLDIGPCAVTSAGLEAVGGLSQLEVLRLRSTRVDDLKPIRGLRNLNDLFITGNPIGDEGLAPVADLAGLKSLTIISSPVGDPGLEHLRGLANLKSLNLSNTRITDAGLASLRGLRKLADLTVRRTAITDRGAEELAKAIPGLRVTR